VRTEAMAEVFSLRLPTAQGAGLKKFSGVWANSGNAFVWLVFGYCCERRFFGVFCVGGCSVWQKIKTNWVKVVGWCLV
jgi:hypothetical protein